MKYTFKNRPTQALSELELTSYQLIVRQEGKERVIPYSAITDVRLECKGGSFLMTIRSLDFGSVRVSNCSYNGDGSMEDQSRQYHTFVRVLHHHLLRVSCGAEFCSGSKPSHLKTKFILLLILSSLVYLMEEYFNVLGLSPFVTTLILLGAGVFVLMAPYLTNRPKSYKPSDIPLNMLPPAH